ncbi:hypothetical protein LCGC14_1201450 [marine sediment metagenome]|uniref:Uncharacterized protein n=1 Tax=marine sediment metagenome TaxID=412755 RepID=A0A0F9PLI9_9ZZZZ
MTVTILRFPSNRNSFIPPYVIWQGELAITHTPVLGEILLGYLVYSVINKPTPMLFLASLDFS